MGGWNFDSRYSPQQLPALPDYSDAKVQKARKKTLLTESIGQGRASMFTSGARGAGAPAVKKTILGG
jgi:hypothetical protein